MKIRTARGFTLIELLIVVGIISVIAAIAVPGLLRARMSGNETSAIGSLRAINAAQSTFSSSCGGNGYAPTLEALNTPPMPGQPGFISPDLSATNIVKSGYYVSVDPDAAFKVVTPQAKTCNNVADSVSAYYAEAHPVAVGSSGQRAFATDTNATLYYSNTGAAPPKGMAGALVLQ